MEVRETVPDQRPSSGPQPSPPKGDRCGILWEASAILTKDACITLPQNPGFAPHTPHFQGF
ncbi:hypothetical protein HMPREF9440_02539 [Sutterella parvirubra YIT 11816]|uniref:Uncharacterized protein n=1 Tax=Sutterella parvirubra YIT 11816 TaxID=762967 RepID=H3KIC7_9BURK|nr:hypothetical protein HMPREF9440_02539 [Sutterella parvirubra YIT 11816]